MAKEKHGNPRKKTEEERAVYICYIAHRQYVFICGGLVNIDRSQWGIEEGELLLLLLLLLLAN